MMKLFIFETFLVGRWMPIRFFSVCDYREAIADINATSPELPWDEYRLRRVKTEPEALELCNEHNENRQLPWGTGGYKWV